MAADGARADEADEGLEHALLHLNRATRLQRDPTEGRVAVRKGVVLEGGDSRRGGGRRRVTESFGERR